MGQIRENPPDLIFMDMRLPGKNGLQLTQEIRWAYRKMAIALLTRTYDIPEYRGGSPVKKGPIGIYVKESLNWQEVEALVDSFGTDPAAEKPGTPARPVSL